MVPVANLLAFSLASLLLIAVPGPSVLFVIGRSLALGRRSGLLSVMGNSLGALFQVAAVAVGLGAVLAQSIVLFTIVKLAGAAYLIYLGIQAIRQHGGGGRAENPTPATSTWRLLGQGFVVGATNPKSIVFFVAVLPQFVDYSAALIPLQLAILGGVFLLIGLVSDSIWALAAGSARRWFARSPRRVSAVNATGGLMMIGLGGTLVLTGNKTS